MHKIDELQCSLEHASLDDRDKETRNYMVQSKLQLCAFDEVKKWYVREKIPQVNPNPKSNDALYFDEDECFFIEFKNGRITNEVNYEINKKIYDSLFILFDLKYIDRKGNLVDTISYTRENMTYILVYNEESNANCGETRQTKDGRKRQEEKAKAEEKSISHSYYRDALYKRIRRLAKKEFIMFGLDQFESYFFKNVYTFTEKEFTQYFIKAREE